MLIFSLEKTTRRLTQSGLPERFGCFASCRFAGENKRNEVQPRFSTPTRFELLSCGFPWDSALSHAMVPCKPFLLVHRLLLFVKPLSDCCFIAFLPVFMCFVFAARRCYFLVFILASSLSFFPVNQSVLVYFCPLFPQSVFVFGEELLFVFLFCFVFAFPQLPSAFCRLFLSDIDDNGKAAALLLRCRQLGQRRLDGKRLDEQSRAEHRFPERWLPPHFGLKNKNEKMRLSESWDFRNKKSPKAPLRKQRVFG